MTKRTFKNLGSIFVVTILISASQNLFSQQTPNYHERLTIEDGLPNNYITCLLKDSKGYLWIGTRSGLVKYDGIRFSHLEQFDQDGLFIGKVINSIIEDKMGAIWIGTRNGLFKYNRETLTISKARLSALESKAKNKIYKIKQWNDSLLLVGAFNGLFLYNLNSHVSSFHSYPDDIGTNFIEIFKNFKNNCAIIRLNDWSFEFDLKKHFYRKMELPDTYFLETVFNNNFILYNLKDNYCYRIDGTNKLSKFKFDHKISKAYSSGDLLYFMSENSILKYDKDFKLIDSISFDVKIQKNERFYIICLQEENNKLIWYGSSHGLIKILPKNRFYYFNKQDGLANNINSIYIDSLNNLYLGASANKSFQISNLSKNILKKKIDDDLIHTINNPSNSRTIFKILGLSSNKLLFLGTNSIFLYDTKTKKITDSYISKKAVYWSAVEKDGVVWAGTSTDPALTKLHIENNSIIFDKSYDKFAYSETAYTFLKDGQNKIWIGGEGLYKITGAPNNYSFEEYLPYYDEVSKRNNQIWSNILELDSAHLLIGTRENGLFIVNIKTKKHKRLTKNDGLLSNEIRSLILDNNKHIWIGTLNGLNQLDLEENKIHKYTIKDGLISNSFNLKACDKTTDGWMFFGTSKGLVYFHPDSLENNQVNYPLTINELKIFDKVSNIEFENNDTIQLEHYQNFFTLEFSLLDFRDPHKIQYEYSLVGNDKAFRKTTGKNPTASYTNVPPGNYVFELKTFDPSDHSIVENLTIPLIIVPAFHQTLLFKMLLIIAIMSVLLIIFYTIYRRQMLNGKLIKLELDLLRSQMNPHFIFNIMSAIQGIVMKNEKIKAVDYLAKFARLMRMNLNYTRTEYITLEKTIQFLETYVKLESLNLDEEVCFEIVVDSELNQNVCLVSPLLIQPFIENAIIHGLAPKNKNMKLTLSIEKNDRVMICKITDNGVGRTNTIEEKKNIKSHHVSVGIKITERSNLLQQKKSKIKKENIKIIDNFDIEGNPIGTTVVLKIPLKENH